MFVVRIDKKIQECVLFSGEFNFLLVEKQKTNAWDNISEVDRIRMIQSQALGLYE